MLKYYNEKIYSWELDKISLNKQKKTMVSAAILSFVLAFLSPAFPFLAPFSGAAASVVFINSKKAYLPIAFLGTVTAYFFAGTLLSGGDFYYALLLELMCMVPALSFAITFRKALKFQYIITITAFATAAALCTVTFLYVYARGGSLSLEGAKIAFSWLINSFEANMNSFIELLKETGNENLIEEYRTAYETLKTLIVEYYIPMFPSLAVTLGFVVAAPSALYIKNAAYRADVAKIGRLSSVKADRLLSVIMAVAYIASMFVKNDAFGITLENFVTVGIAYFAVSGFGFISFMMNIRKTKTVTKHIVYTVICAIAVLISGLELIAMVGIFEGVVQTRNKFLKMMKQYGFDPEKDSTAEILEKMKEKAERGELQRRERDKEDAHNQDIPWYERDEYKNLPNEEENGETTEDKENKE